MENVTRIASFSVNHDYIDEGIYISRIDGDITTYDMRTRRPNMGDYMDNITMHSVEHMIATYIRSSEIGDKVIYFGPMGCRTGFYFITTDEVSKAAAVELTRAALAFCADFEGEIPGVSAKECGNYRDHNLPVAKKEAEEMVKVLESWKEENLVYPSR